MQRPGVVCEVLIGTVRHGRRQVPVTHGSSEVRPCICLAQSPRSRAAPPAGAPRPLGLTRGAGSVDDQQWAGEAGYGGLAAVAACLREQGIEHAPDGGEKSSPTTAVSGWLFSSTGRIASNAFSSTRNLGRGIGQMNSLLGHASRQFSRHQHRAKSRAGIEQHEIVRPVQAEDRNAGSPR